MSIIKLITCEVDNARKTDFAKAQLIWRELTCCHGFEGQFGGWCDTTDKTGAEAIVVGIWQDQTAIDNFMQLVHDELAEKSGQSCTYRQCKVEHFECVMSIPVVSACAVKSAETISHINYFRGLRDCEEFLNDFECTLHPELSQNPGCAQAWLGRRRKQDDDFLLITRWLSIEEASSYLYLLSDSKVKSNISFEPGSSGVSSDLIQEQLSWRVFPD